MLTASTHLTRGGDAIRKGIRKLVRDDHVEEQHDRHVALRKLMRDECRDYDRESTIGGCERELRVVVCERTPAPSCGASHGVAPEER